MAVIIDGRVLDPNSKEDMELLEKRIDEAIKSSNMQPSKPLSQNATPMERRWAAENEDIAEDGKL